MTRVAKHQAGFALLWIASLVVGWRALIDTFSLSLRDEEYTHVLLILPISAALIFLEWRSLRNIISRNLRSGCACLAVAVAVACIALGWSASLPSDWQLSMRMLALVLAWIGAFILCFGARASRLVLFPLCFLSALVPIPQSAVNVIIGFLQLGSAWAAHVLFAACGVPVMQDGVSLSIPGLTLHVAQECSSIRSSSMFLVTAAVLAHLLLRSPWRKALVIGLAIPLSVAKNGIRIFTIAMLGTRVDPGYLTGRLHHEGGSVFFAIVLLVLFAMLWMFRRVEDRSLNAALKPAMSNAAGD